ncbi:MAG: PaaX family transcriptional regulator C-terminal domain-containing protein [Aeromicrobium sp.]|uniref:PaaX family transcriptional regulator C-terminal domain-containing protein n=1 Tax=Aeromicrobium sp. TaxID=1871063 RepID=UPI002615E714|nr:PaaX family transcriptional regulator C-terminal domain-containing protein [Aeromicrobium sp.]MDF1705254.1 PaaX family transcriptional regulator C-terminal domain-containing protein [Aeromicrobium sp.]
MTTTAQSVRPLTARSAILSLLLGAHPPEAPGSSIVGWGRALGVTEPAVRVALTRMVAAGDLERTDSVYRLSPRLLRRQERQDAAIEQRTSPWNGEWHAAVVTSVGAGASVRADLRQRMVGSRFGELREGFWMRPANLEWTPDAAVAASLEVMTVRPARPAPELAALLFDLPGWAATTHDLAASLAASENLAERIAIAAAVVRHLVADPLLPDALLPADWPGPELRRTYGAFREELVASVSR